MASLGGAGESVAVVVGAGELGSARATLLAGAGFTVVAVDRTPNALDELPEGIRREVGDTTDQAMAKTLIDRIAGEAGPPEVLVNTIGGFLLDEAANAKPQNLRVMMDVNLGAALWLSHSVEPYMRQRGSAHNGAGGRAFTAIWDLYRMAARLLAALAVRPVPLHY